MNNTSKKYLLWFAQENLDFRFAEIHSLLSLLKIDMKYVQTPTTTQPYWIVQFNSEEDVKLLASRSVSLRSCVELWAHANEVNKLHESMKQYPKTLIDKHIHGDQSFKIQVETFGRHFTQKEKVDKIEKFNYLPITGPVRLKNPDVCLSYIEYYGVENINPPEEPLEVFFGRWIVNGLRQLIEKLSLKTRKFIGNTSMDPQFSLLMANQAQVKDGDLVLDPFVGSGSLLVAAAQFGAYVSGSDIDYLMLHARTKPSRIRQKKRDLDESIKTNMKQYNLESKYLDVLVSDFSTSFWRHDMHFDSIITDPPYGIREATERVGTAREKYSVQEKHLATHIPAKIEYGIRNIYKDLLTFSAKHLKINGRLVCWFPVFREENTPEGLPSHPSLKLIANSEQVLTKSTSRRLLTFEKFQHFIEAEENSDHNNIVDFREKYFVLREETRQVRRTKEAQIREKNRLAYEQSKQSK